MEGEELDSARLIYILYICTDSVKVVFIVVLLIPIFSLQQI